MIKKLSLLMTLATTIAMTPVAMATTTDNDTTDWLSPQGWYAEGTAGSNLYYLGVVTSSSTFPNGFDGFGWSAAMGYRGKPGGTAVEFGFMQNIFNTDISTETASGLSADVSTRVATYVPYVAARWDLQIAHSRVAFIPKIGAMFVYLPEETAKTTIDGQSASGTLDRVGFPLPFVGAGFSYAITKNVRLVAQYQGAVYGIAGAGLFSAGLDYYFS